MQRGEVKDGKKGKGKFLVFLMLFVFSCLIVVSLVAASDVAYIYKSEGKVDENVLDVFSELGLEYDLIDERYLPKDLSDYKIIFVGDERLSKAEYVPVTEKASIIMNYYFGEEFGLTDYDGVSKLAATSPLEVKKDNKIVQVYTDAEYYTGGISIPYYYLDDENKAPQMVSVARTYIGDDYDFGDVISYAYPGAELLNDGTTGEKVCFFGVVESDYWTPAARDMFKDCVEFVSITCYSDIGCGEEHIGEEYCEGKEVYRDVTNYLCGNPGTVDSECSEDVVKELVEVCEDSCINGECREIECYTDADCDDQDVFTKDNCINPGSVNSYCENYPIDCVKDSDCGESGWLGEEYCDGDDVYRDYQEFDCMNDECFDFIESKLIEQCSDTCRNGKCIERECIEDSDCQEDYYSDNYCQEDNVYRDLHDFSCQEEVCAEEIIQELAEGCVDICLEGECREIECSLTSDCGKNHFSGDLYCLNGNVYEDFTSYLCNIPGTVDSYCSEYTKPILRDYCEGDCVDAKCITCFNDASCGTDGFIGEKYCEGNDVYQNYQEFSCINAGTSESDCLSEVSPVLVEECLDLCVEGECKEVECYTDSDCDDSDLYTHDECNNPGSVDSYCSNTEMNCINDNDCGITGFAGEEFCYEDDLFKNYKNSQCVNAGTKESHCVAEEGPVLLMDCGEDECQEWQRYCKEGDVWRSRECYDRGCSEKTCTNELTTEEELVEVCDYGCENGGCIGECIETEDCPEKCTQESHKLYNLIGCNNYLCEYSGYQCVIGKCGAECDEDSDCLCEEDYCDGTTLVDYPDYSSCGTSGSEGCLCQTCEAVLIPDSPECIEYDCLFDSDCGEDYYEKQYCEQEGLYHDLHDFSCIDGECIETITEEKVEDCGESYCGKWSSYCEDGDVYRKRTCYEKGCLNGQCYEESYEEKEFVEECGKCCQDGQCKECGCGCEKDYDCSKGCVSC